jgi:hypothetical protein
MPKRTPDQLRYWFQTNKIIDQQLRAYYRARMTEELPPPLLATLKKLDEGTERQEDATNPTATEIGFD